MEMLRFYQTIAVTQISAQYVIFRVVILLKLTSISIMTPPLSQRDVVAKMVAICYQVILVW